MLRFTCVVSLWYFHVSVGNFWRWKVGTIVIAWFG